VDGLTESSFSGGGFGTPFCGVMPTSGSGSAWRGFSIRGILRNYDARVGKFATLGAVASGWAKGGGRRGAWWNSVLADVDRAEGEMGRLYADFAGAGAGGRLRSPTTNSGEDENSAGVMSGVAPGKKPVDASFNFGPDFHKFGRRMEIY